MIQRVARSVWSIELAKPGGSAAPYTRCYLIGDDEGGVHVVDPGWDLEENWVALLSALAELDRDANAVRTVIITHLHNDHLGMAERVRAASGASVVMHRTEQLALAAQPVDAEQRLKAWGVPAPEVAELRDAFDRWQRRTQLVADLLVDDGAVLPIPGREIRVVLTPGHTPGHICLHDPAERLLFTGDHVLPHLHPGVGLGPPGPTNPIADYHVSLARVAELADRLALPGHGEPFTGIAARCAAIADHYRRRTAAVGRILGESDLSVWQVASELSWSVPLSEMRPASRRSALAQTAMHVDLVRGG